VTDSCNLDARLEGEIDMKRIVLAAVAAALLGAGAASAHPLHPIHGGGHGPVFHPGHGGLHGGPVGFHPGPAFGHGFGPVGFHHWGYGQFLPRAWLVPAAFVADYAAYDLAAPPADFEWVRNGPDALLVNLDTGMVVQVVPGAFA
jgi:Ni/Co efflux regulator RcnB